MNNCIQAAFSGGGGGGNNLTVAEVVITSSFSTTSTSFVDVTGLTQSKPDVEDGNCFTIGSVTSYNNTTSKKNKFALDDNGSRVAFVSLQTDAGNDSVLLALSPMIDTSSADGNTVKMVMCVEGGTGYAYYSSDVAQPKICSIAI